MKLPCGVILAGGTASRMGGGDKSLIQVGNRSILDHVIARLSPQVTQCALNANGDPARFAGFELPILPDSIPDYPGPLAGVLAGLDWAAAMNATSIVTVAADTPFFPTDLVHRLGQAAGPSGLCLAASVSTTGQRQVHPTFALWPVSLRDKLRADLMNGAGKMMTWATDHDASYADFPCTAFDPFFNINTPEQMEEARIIYLKTIGT